jgi:hypothetical protein
MLGDNTILYRHDVMGSFYGVVMELLLSVDAKALQTPRLGSRKLVVVVDHHHAWMEVI